MTWRHNRPGNKFRQICTTQTEKDRGTNRAHNKNIENHWQLFCFFNSFNSSKHRRILARIRDSNVPR